MKCIQGFKFKSSFFLFCLVNVSLSPVFAASAVTTPTPMNTTSNSAKTSSENTSQPNSATVVAKVVWVDGVFKAMNDKGVERDLKRKSPIYLHDTLVTNGTSQAEVAFTDNTLTTFHQNTKYTIKDYAYSPNKKGAGKFTAELVAGGFRTITGSIAKNNPNNYATNMPVATIGVRGTDYAVFYDGKKAVVAHYAGEPCVTNVKGSICLSKAHPYASVDKDQIPISVFQQPDVFKNRLKITKVDYASLGGSRLKNGNAGDKGFCITKPKTE